MTGGIWFTSDLHFGHEKVSGLRGFLDPYSHDIVVAGYWQGTVGKNDTVYVLGDLTCDQRKEDYALEMISYLNGTKHLIAGNHDSVSSIHRHGWKRQRKYLEVFESVRDFGKIRLNKRDILLSHYPYSTSVEADHGEVRYEAYRLPDTGVPLLHGHTHLAHQRRHISTLGTPQIHVGLDAWDLMPVSLGTIDRLLKGEN